MEDIFVSVKVTAAQLHPHEEVLREYGEPLLIGGVCIHLAPDEGGGLPACGHHRWELPGNYRDFRGVMVIYLFCRRTKRVLITPIIDFEIYILTQSLIILRSSW